MRQWIFELLTAVAATIAICDYFGAPGQMWPGHDDCQLVAALLFVAIQIQRKWPVRRQAPCSDRRARGVLRARLWPTKNQ